MKKKLIVLSSFLLALGAVGCSRPTQDTPVIDNGNNGNENGNNRRKFAVKSFNLYFHYKSVVVIFAGALLAVFACIKTFGFNKL